MIKRFIFFALAISFFSNIFADNFYWVNNGGDWSDYANHWSTASGNTTLMHTRVPDANDVVIFDFNSFTDSNQVVVADTSNISCFSMIWTGVLHKPEFKSTNSDTLNIYGSLYLATQAELLFNFLGHLIFQQPLAGQTIIISPQDHGFKGNVTIDVNAGTIELMDNLSLDQKYLNLIDGSLDMNGYTIYCQHFNTTTSNDIAIAVIHPALIDVDTLFCYGSLHFDDSLILSAFDGFLYFRTQAVDSNYFSFGNHVLQSELYFTGNKKIYFLSDLNTTGKLDLAIDGQFYSQNHAITCAIFQSNVPLNRNIQFGTSEINVQEFSLVQNGLTINSLNASLIIGGPDTTRYYSNKTDLRFHKIQFLPQTLIIVSGNLNADSLIIQPGSTVLLSNSSEHNVSNLVVSGNCGDYVYIRAFCPSCYECFPTTSCIATKPKFISLTPQIVNYVKLSFVATQGSFTANNSFDEGGNQGWTINEPVTTSTLYWIGNTGDWNVKTNWSDSSGGASQQCIPSKKTNVVFDNNSFSSVDTVSIDLFSYCAAMTWSGLPSIAHLSGQGILFITDSIVLDPMLIADFSGSYELQNNNPSDTISVLTNGVILNAPLNIEGTANWDFVDPLNVHSLVLNEGNINFSGNLLQTQSLISETTTNRIIDISNTAIVLNGNNTVWNLDSTNLSVISTNSVITINGTEPGKKIFNGTNLTYNDLHCVSPSVEITGSNDFNLLSVIPGSTLILEAGMTTTIDSLIALGDCQERVNLISEDGINPAVLNKSGWDTLNVGFAYLKNIVADTSGSRLYFASNTIRNGDVTGWIFSDTLTGQRYYWLGKTSNWHDTINWQVNALPALCIPSMLDTVIVDSLIMSSSLTDTMLIQKNAHCKYFDASNMITYPLIVVLEQDLFVGTDLFLADSVSFQYNYTADPETFIAESTALFFIPDQSNFNFDPANADFKIKIVANPVFPDDTVFLQSNLLMDTLSGLFFTSGTFVTNDFNLNCGFIQSFSNASKTINFGSSTIHCIIGFGLQDNSVLNLNSGTSIINMDGNYFFGSYFDGGSQQYFDVHFSAVSDIEEDNYHLYDVYGSNNYHNLHINKAVSFAIEKSSIQTVSGNFQANGTCAFPIILKSSEKNTQAQIVNGNLAVDTVFSCYISDINIQPGGFARLSFDEGGNSNWTFDSVLAADAQYAIPYPACANENILFTNSSVSMWGSMDHLTFEWIIEEIDTLTTTDLNYLFTNSGNYLISLKATDTISGCYDIYRDTLELEDHTVYLSTSEPGLEICEGETVNFTAGSDIATQFHFYLNNSLLNLGSDTINIYSTDSLVNNDTIRVEAILNGCVKSSQNLVYTVNSLPIISLSCSEVDTTICFGDSITFTVSGADEYEFFIDGGSVSAISTTNTFSTTNIPDSAIVTAFGYDTITGCKSLLSNAFMVRVLPNPVITLTSSTDPPIICQGDNLNLTAFGGSEYEFFVDGISQGPPSPINIFSSSSLTNGNIINVTGYTIDGCHSDADTLIQVIVNPSPDPILTCDDIDSTICLGDQITFYAAGASEYEFFVDGVSQGVFSSSNSFSTTTLTHNQTISLDGRIGGCVRSSLGSITIQVLPVLTLNSSDFEICENDTVTFTASGDSIYQFYIDGIPTGPASPVNVYSSSTLTNGQIISVSGTTGACLPSAITIIVNPLPSVSLLCSEPDTTICSGDQITFNANGAFQYEFFVDGVSQGAPSLLSQFSTTTLTDGQTVTASGVTASSCTSTSTNIYTVTVHDYPTVSFVSEDSISSICSGDTLHFTATGADFYEFFISGITQGSPSVDSVFTTTSVFNNAIVTVQGSSNGCVSSAPESFTFTVYNIPIVLLTPLTPISVCEGDTITLSASGATNYEFFVNSVSQGIPSTNTIFQSSSLQDNDVISVVGYQNICFSETASPITVDINQLPAISFTTSIPPSGICYGDTAIFSVSGALSFQFYVDGFPWGNQFPAGNVEIPDLENDQTISVIGYNNACFNNADTIFTSLVHYVTPQLVSSYANNAVCSDDVVTITATGADLYEFYLDGSSLGAPSASNSINLGNITNGQYAVVFGTDLSTNCVGASPAIYFYVGTKPEITVTPGLQFCQYDSVLLESDILSGNQWYYNFGMINGATSNEYVAYDGGVYSVSVTSGNEGSIFSCGNNGYGQFGDGTVLPSFLVIPSLLTTSATHAKAGNDFIVILDENGDVYAWGNNIWGNLGIGTYSASSVPVQLGSLSNIHSIAAGSNHVLAIQSDSTLVSWGRNNMGQLGYGNLAASNFPGSVLNITKVIAIDAGETHSLALCSDGTVWAWGGNAFGQLGNGNLTNQNIPVQIPTLDSIVGIAAGSFHSMAIRADGSLWLWGSNENGQLGIGNLNSSNIPVKNPYLKNIEMVDGGKDHTVVVNSSGKAYSFGNNSEGQLGIPSIVSTNIPAKINIIGVQSVYCGTYNSFVTRDDGSCWSWGKNNAGQLGNQSTVTVLQPERIDQLFSVNQVTTGTDFTAFISGSTLECGSDEVTLIIDSVPDVIITQIGNTLSTISGDTYQWFLNHIAIPGATNQSVQITAQGIYSVFVTFANGCSATSDDFPYFVTIEEWFANENALIVPNPNNGTFELQLNMPIETLNKIHSWTLYSVTGAIIEEHLEFEAETSQMITIEQLAPGIYYLQLSTESEILHIKMIVNK